MPLWQLPIYSSKLAFLFLQKERKEKKEGQQLQVANMREVENKLRLHLFMGYIIVEMLIVVDSVICKDAYPTA